MKKLVLMFVAIAAISFASCQQKAAPAVEEVDTTEVAVDTVAPADTVVADTVVAE